MIKKAKLSTLYKIKELIPRYVFICTCYSKATRFPTSSIAQLIPELHEEIIKEIARTRNSEDTYSTHIAIYYPKELEISNRIDLIDRVINQIKNNNNQSPIKYKVNNIEFTIHNGIAKSKYSDLSIADLETIHKWVLNFNSNYNPYGSSTVYLSGSNLYFNSTFINELTQLLNLTIKSKDI